MNRFRRSLLVLAAGLVVLSGGLVAAYEIENGTGARTNPATPAEAAIGGAFSLVDSAGSQVTDKTFRGKWLLIYFGYTACPDVCPTTLAQIATALDKLGPLAGKLTPLFISVDPQRDTPRVVGDYTKAFDRRIVGLTGTPQQIAAVAHAYGVYYAPQTGKGVASDYPVDHSSYLYVVDPAGKFVTAFGSTANGDELAARLSALMGTPSS